MHIHPSSPNSNIDDSMQMEENAATKIQAGFRGYRVRKQMQHQQPRKHASNGYQQQHSNHVQHVPEQPLGDADADTSTCSKRINDSTQPMENSSKEERSATKIQAGVRGFLVRKKQKIATDAATKIQASFRGFKSRKETQKMKQK